MKKHQRSFFVAGFVSIVILVSIILSGCPDGVLPQSLDLSVTLTVSNNTNGNLLQEVSFNPAGKTASVKVANELEAVKIGIKKDIAGASVTVNGQALTVDNDVSIDLDVGTNTVTVVVTPEDGTAVTYTLEITREAAVGPSNNASLSGLSLSTGALSPAFASDIYSYTASVSNDTETITVTPTAVDSDASITVNGIEVTSGSASGDLTLSVGKNTITVLVTAEDGVATKTYTLVVERLSTVVEPPEITDIYVFEENQKFYMYFSILDDNSWSTVADNEGGTVLAYGEVRWCDNEANEMILHNEKYNQYIKVKWTDPDPQTREGILNFFPGYSTFEQAMNSSSFFTVTFYDTLSKVPPVIILNGDNPDLAALGGTYTDPGATVSDWNTAETTIYADTPWGWDTSTSGTHSLHYNYTDTDGNHAAEVIREVGVGSGTGVIIIQ